MINILLCGANGRMGNAVRRIAKDNAALCIAAGFDINTEGTDFPVYDNLNAVTESIDCIIDFSHPSLTDEVLDYARKNKIPAVICTTGLSKEQISKIEFYSKETPIFFSANMSLGVNLLIDLVSKASKVLESSFDIEIVEKHHNQKLDAPSGTALAIADAISDTVAFNPKYVFDRHSVRKKRDKEEIGIHAVRGGNIVGEHTVIFAGNDEVIEVKHSATSREVFAVGAVRAAIFMYEKGPGLYSMSDLVKEY
ncbi:MAG: 4-hydroxy-tetrahydrodipicolinate reductase [Clostridia bacterium]|nr:4-hydroxy-tetrahydrodipicolinate reductase [Clostridia bacterium]MBQ9757342.1 4-hydroxy-tetrahydrodipicolinate reductase [Clostridia bacterium]